MDDQNLLLCGYGSRISCLNLTLLHEWCVLNRLSNAKLKKKTLFISDDCVGFYI
jgi:hypothetical protein